MQTRRKFLPTLAGLPLAACQQRGKKRIAVIPKATASVFWVSVEKGAQTAGKEFDVEILWNGPALETEYSRQIQIIDSMVAQRVDGIVIAPSERQVLVAPIERAAKAHIPVTVFDSGIDTETYVSYVATDNVEGGRLAARTLAQMIGGKGKVGVIEHAPGSASTMDREKGFQEVMQKEFPGIVIAGRQFSMGDRAKARAGAENIMTSNPDLVGIFASAEPASIGSALAIRSREAGAKVNLVAFDSTESMIADTRDGIIDAMIVQDAYKMGYEAVRTIVDKLGGKTPPKRVDLYAQVVKQKDLEDEKVKKLLNP